MGRADFLVGQFFDIRLEVHSPVNGSEAREGEPDPDFTFTIAKKGRNVKPQSAAGFFKVKEPLLEKWDFTWFEGRFRIHQFVSTFHASWSCWFI
jgi:hypothetical protein